MTTLSRRALLLTAVLPAVGACTPVVPELSAREARRALRLSPSPGALALVNFETTPFPYHGTIPGKDKPFMDVNDNGRLGHSSLRNGVLWEDETYNDRRVLLSIPKGFDPRRPAALVVFLHGNEARLDRDVRDRQGLPRQIAQSGINAVLVAPQFALDAKDSSAGRFWEPGVFREFLREAARKLADLYDGAHDAAFVFDDAPVILVAYSGGYLPAAAALRYGGTGRRVHGVVLLDALYGEDETFERYILERGQDVFVSLYGKSSRPGNEAMIQKLAGRDVPFATALGAALAPGSVTFVDAGDDVPHVDFVTAALGGDPLANVLARLRGYPRTPAAGLVASE